MDPISSDLPVAFEASTVPICCLIGFVHLEEGESPNCFEGKPPGEWGGMGVCQCTLVCYNGVEFEEVDAPSRLKRLPLWRRSSDS